MLINQRPRQGHAGNDHGLLADLRDRLNQQLSFLRR